ncbi:MAG: DUF302 domain-containing protein [Bacteroidales bacterium]|nr:DUF302 domain-containing protein [Bacteroidales bacterium]
MNYYYSIKVKDTFVNARKKVTDALAAEGFGVLSEINIRDAFKNKLGVEFRNYVILGACNPAFSYKALQAEDKIGTLLPCNVILQETGDGYTEVAAVDPQESMKMVNNPEVADIASTIRVKLVNALNSIK